MEFVTSVVTTKSVGEAVASVEAAMAGRRFSILFQLNVNKTLEGKGFDLAHEVRILEVCSAPKAKQALEANPAVAYFLPCKIVVMRVGEETRIGITRPTALMGVLGDESLSGLAREVEAELLEIVEAAK